MAHFDPDQWSEFDALGEIEIPQKGALRLRLSRPTAAYLTIDGVETLVGYAADFDVSFAAREGVTLRVDYVDGLRAFVQMPLDKRGQEPSEVFTSMDRKPMLSGHNAELAAAMRRHKLELMAVTRAAKDELRGVLAARDAVLGRGDPSSVADPALSDPPVINDNPDDPV